MEQSQFAAHEAAENTERAKNELERERQARLAAENELQQLKSAVGKK